MEINVLSFGKNNVSEIISSEVLIKGESDALEIMGETQVDYLIMYEHNFEKDVFDLSTKKLGDVLQKFSNYRINLAIIGDFSKYPSKTLKDFIYETNRHGKYLFVSSLDEVKKVWQQ